MKMTDIKAPAALKKRTQALMEQIPENNRKPWGTRFAVTAACGLVLAVLLVFSGIIIPGQNAVEKGGQTIVSNGQNDFVQNGQTVVSNGQNDFVQNEQTVVSNGKGTSAHMSANNDSPRNNASGIVNSDPDHFVPYYRKPSTDHTSADDIAAIKAAFSVQCPLISYQVSRAYNDFQENGQPLHPETDMAAPEGTEIYPLCEGTVLETGFAAGPGRYIVIDHGDGLVSSYAHCKELLVSEGDTVTASSMIATVGKTGQATGPFLAFSVTWNGKPVNPEALFN